MLDRWKITGGLLRGDEKMSKRVVRFYTDEDGKTRPITEKTNYRRVPFGIQRELALAEVEKLRKEGERARLIETNRKRKLYAPYESALKPQNSTEENKQEHPQNTEEKSNDVKKESDTRTGESAMKKENTVEPLGLGEIKKFEADGGIFELPWGNTRVGKPWIAEVGGLNDQYGIERQFLKTKALEFEKGYPSKLGIPVSELTEGKIYEMKDPMSWGHPDERTYIRILSKSPDSFKAEEISYEDLLKYLRARR